MTYSEMKDSGVPWIGEIPAHWEITRSKIVFQNVTIKNHPDAMVLSLYRDLGVLPKESRDDNHNVTSEDTAQYKFVEPGNLVINKMKAWQGSLAVSAYSGIVSPAYYVCKFRSNAVDKRYVHYLLRSSVYAQEFERLSTGMRVGQWDLGIDDFLKIPILLPETDEQKSIADFLDAQCGEIDAIIGEAKTSIEEYKRWKASVIYQAVTKGLDPDAPMKDSGVKGMGIIPAHWKLAPLKYISVLDPSCQNACLSDDDEVSFAPMECIRTDKRIPKTAPKFRDSGTYSKFNDGDIAIAKVTPCFENGNICIMEGLVNGYAFGSSELFNVRAKAIQTRFLFYYMQSSCFINGAVATMTGVAGLKRVSSYYMRNARAPIPPNDEQSEIVAYLDKQCSTIDAVVDEKESLISELEAYKKSLIYEAVTGKRKVG